jgi:hypothetical protein
MRTLTLFDISVVPVWALTSTPAWTLTQTDKGSSPEVNVLITMAQRHWNHITYCRFSSLENLESRASECKTLPLSSP